MIASVFFKKSFLFPHMIKKKIGASFPDHITREIEKRADALQTTPSQYLAQIAEWWYGQNSPPVTSAEARARAEQKTPAKKTAA
jgi:hypothetical protein